MQLRGHSYGCSKEEIVQVFSGLDLVAKGNNVAGGLPEDAFLPFVSLKRLRRNTGNNMAVAY